MPDDLSSTLELPPVAPSAPLMAPATEVAPPSRLEVFLDACRHPKNHKQAVRFLCVGGSGYVVNNIAFAILIHIGVQHTVSFWVASLIGTANNFWWNRNWTFDAKHHHIARQGVRFLLTSEVVVGFAYVIYLGLVALGMPKLPANALAYVIATPFSFVAQKLWSFKA